MRVLGVDPGGISVGLVVRDGDEVVAWSLIHRRAEQGLDLWCKQVLGMLDVTCGRPYPPDLIAVEGLHEPTPHMGMTSLRGLLDTATVLGAVIAWAWPDPDLHVVVVPPSGHGSLPVEAYPDELVGSGEKRGKGRMRHVRAAHDIAHAGRVLARGKVTA